MIRAAAFALVTGFAVVAFAEEPRPAIPLKAPQKSEKGTPAKKEPPKKPAMPKTELIEAQALTQLLREVALKKIPDPVTQSKQNWGNQKAITVIHRHREGFRIWTEPKQEMVNDGVWRRITVRIPEPEKIAIAVVEVTHPAEGKALITVAAIAERVEVRFEQQIWRNGLRLYGGETRAHCLGALEIKAEVVRKTVFKPGDFFPEVTVTLKVTDAEIYYGEPVVDHTAGLDGEAAKVVGDLLLRTVKAVKPDLEKELCEKAEAAIVKAGGTREFKLALDKLIEKKPGK